MRSMVLSGLALLWAGPALAQPLRHMGENELPVAIVRVLSRPDRVEIVLEAQAGLPGTCWYREGPNSPFLLANGQRFRFLGGQDLPWCPDARPMPAGTTHVLRFEPLPAKAESFSLIEGEGGQTQALGQPDPNQRFWNFLRVPLTR